MQMRVLLIALILQVSGGKSATGFFYLGAARSNDARGIFIISHLWLICQLIFCTDII
jgi:hypothetical protein